MDRKINTDRCSLQYYEDEFNRRVRVDDYTGDQGAIIDQLTKTLPAWAEKLIVKVRTEDVPQFVDAGFVQEGFIKGYFNGADLFFLVKYPDPGRGISKSRGSNQEILKRVYSKVPDPSIPVGVDVAEADSFDVPGLVQLYSNVFEIYPSPISQLEYIIESMKKGTTFVYIRNRDHILSAASAEINTHFSNAELTDCATLKGARGRGHMQLLINKLEQIMDQRGIKCKYTIARSQSVSINRVFYNLGYTFGGRLINNCYIYSGLEDMNIWYKY